MSQGHHLQNQLIDLQVAAALVCEKLGGAGLSNQLDGPALAQLNTVAHALCTVAPIWAKGSDGRFHEMDTLDILEGRFERGAQRLLTKHGEKIEALAISRGDMVAAVNILSAARVNFDRAQPQP